MPVFQVIFSKKAERDFKYLLPLEQKELGIELKSLQSNPFPFKKKIKKIKGSRELLYRLRVDFASQSYRVFFSILKPHQVLLLRIVTKKAADRVLAILP